MAAIPDERAEGHGTTGPGVVTFGFDVASAVVLMATHVAAAAIVVPAIARRLRG